MQYAKAERTDEIQDDKSQFWKTPEKQIYSRHHPNTEKSAGIISKRSESKLPDSALHCILTTCGASPPTPKCPTSQPK
jgi:hypothetical protein